MTEAKAYKPLFADLVVVIACSIVAAVWFGHSLAVWRYQDVVAQYQQAPKKCAVVPGEQVVSTTADTCTYANSYGRATKQRRAI